MASTLGSSKQGMDGRCEREAMGARLARCCASCAFVLGMVCLATALAACDGDDALVDGDGHEDGGERDVVPTSDASVEGGTGGGGAPVTPMGGTGGGLFPLAGFPAFPAFPDGPQCYLRVAAECDGDEDCEGGAVCCGDFDDGDFTYTRIACSKTCEPASRQYRLCHPGDTCPLPGQVCRHSQILPSRQFAVCAAPSLLDEELTGRAIAGEVLCGDRTCGAGLACCLRARFDPSAPPGSANQELEPHCVEDQSDCDCDVEPPRAPDADAG